MRALLDFTCISADFATQTKKSRASKKNIPDNPLEVSGQFVPVEYDPAASIRPTQLQELQSTSVLQPPMQPPPILQQQPFMQQVPSETLQLTPVSQQPLLLSHLQRPPNSQSQLQQVPVSQQPLSFLHSQHMPAAQPSSSHSQHMPITQQPSSSHSQHMPVTQQPSSSHSQLAPISQQLLPPSHVQQVAVSQQPSPFSHLQQASLWNSQQPSFPPPPPLLEQQMPLHTGSQPQSFLQLLNSSDLETFGNTDTSGHASAGLEPPQFLSSDYPQLSDFDAINRYAEEDDEEPRGSPPGSTEPLEEDDGLYLEADTTIRSSDQPQHSFTPGQFFSGLPPDHPTSNHPDLTTDTTTVQADVTELNRRLSTLVHKVSCQFGGVDFTANISQDIRTARGCS